MQPTARDLEMLAQDKKASGDYATAMRLRLQLEELYQGLGVSPIEKAKNLNWIAFLGVCTGNLAEAERAAQRCLELYRPLATEHDERLATYLTMLACVLAERKEFDEAVPYGEAALAIFVKNHAETDSFIRFRSRDVQRMRNHDIGAYIDREL